MAAEEKKLKAAQRTREHRSIKHSVIPEVKTLTFRKHIVSIS